MAEPARHRRALARGLALALAAGLVACAPHVPGPRPSAAELQPLLNSERIEKIFGSYGVEVLEAGSRLRVASLYSLENGSQVCRTLALTAFPETIDPRVGPEHRAILGGASIGATFARNGWQVEKTPRHLGETRAAPGSRVARRMELATPQQLAVYAYTLTVRRAGVAVDYATLLELYHPAYLRRGDVRDLLVGQPFAQPVRDPGVAQLLTELEPWLAAP